MSRRHKENDIVNINKPEIVESHEDGHLEKSRSTFNSDSLLDKLLTVSLKSTSATRYIAEKVANVIDTAVTKALSEAKIEVDDKWVKIPRSYFEDELFGAQTVEEVIEPAPQGRGRKLLNRLINRVSDSKIVGYVKRAYKSAKKLCSTLIENTTHFCACCLPALFKVFAPDDDPYQKLSHYHSLMEPAFPDLMSRKTLSNYYRWFVDWRAPLTSYMGSKEKKEKLRHNLWEKLVAWICDFFRKIAPQYAFA